jgi:hypothetical protein
MIFNSAKTTIIGAAMLCFASYAQAQKNYTQGVVTYGVEYALTAEQAPMASMLPNEQVVKFNGNFIKTEIQQGPASITILQNFAEKQGLMLIDVPVAQMQFAVKLTKEDQEKNEANAPKLSDFKATGEKQKIGDYNTEKYTYKDEKGGAYELWLTNDFALPAGFYGKQFSELKGSLVKYTTFQNGMKITLTLKKLSEDKVGPFTLDVPSGYELKTMQEIMAMQGGGE